MFNEVYLWEEAGSCCRRQQPPPPTNQRQRRRVGLNIILKILFFLNERIWKFFNFTQRTLTPFINSYEKYHVMSTSQKAAREKLFLVSKMALF